MAIQHAQPGEIINVRPLGSALAEEQTKTLVKTDRMEIIRLIMTAGKEIPTHTAPGEIVVHCLEGRTAFTCFGETCELEPGQFIYLPPDEPHAVKGIEDGSLLLTILLPGD